MRKIKIAVIGIGRKGRDHVKTLTGCFADRFELVAVCDTDPARTDDIEAPKKYRSLEELLRDPEVEMVVIATRHLDHVPMAIRILESGRYCGIEKPVASSVAEMRRLQAASEAHPGKLFLLHNRRFESEFNRVRKLLDSGMLGEVNYIKLYRSVGYCRRNDWMTMPEFYGGLLTNWGPHLIDQALQLLASPVRELWADMRHCVSIGAGDDLFKIVMKGENGRVADVEVTGANAMPGREMEVICSRGTIVHEGDRKLKVRMLDPAVPLAELKPHPENPPLSYGNFDEKLEFVEAVYGPAQVQESDMWKFIHDDICGVAPYPVKFGEGMEVVRITEEVIRRTGFAPLQKFIQ